MANGALWLTRALTELKQVQFDFEQLAGGQIPELLLNKDVKTFKLVEYDFPLSSWFEAIHCKPEVWSATQFKQTLAFASGVRQSPAAVALQYCPAAHSVASHNNLFVYVQTLPEQASVTQSSWMQFAADWQHVPPGPGKLAQSGSAQSVSPSQSLSRPSVQLYWFSVFNALLVVHLLFVAFPAQQVVPFKVPIEAAVHWFHS